MVRRDLALVILAALLITNVSSSYPLKCITEFRETTFYPNGTQKIGEDWIVLNVTNSLPSDMYNVVIEYRNISVFVPHIAPGQRVVVNPYTTLKPEEFNLTIEVQVKGEFFNYTVTNGYDFPVEVNITIPKFEGYGGCENCRVLGDAISINLSLEGGESGYFSIISSSGIPDGKIHFRIEGVSEMVFSSPLDFSVEKERRNNVWISTFRTFNPFPYPLNATINAWVEINGSRTYLFNETPVLESGKNWSRTVRVESGITPVFYMKVDGRAKGLCEVEVLPAYRYGGRYIVGWGILKGVKHVPVKTIPIAPVAPVTTPATPATPVPTPATPTPQVPAPATPTPERITPAPRPVTPQQSPTPMPVQRVEAIPPPPKEIAKVYVATMLPASYGLFIFFILPAIVNRKGVVAIEVDARSLLAIASIHGGRIYSAKPMAGVLIITPDPTLVDSIVDAYGLKREYAEGLAVAVALKKPIVTSNDEVVKAAINMGCVVIKVGG